MIRFLTFAVISVAVLLAQESTGSISGRVLDVSGAAVAGAEVTATQTDTGTTRRAKADNEGTFVFTNLPIGPYSVSAVHNGFKKAIESGLQLHVSEHLAHDFQLQV